MGWKIPAIITAILGGSLGIYVWKTKSASGSGGGSGPGPGPGPTPTGQTVNAASRNRATSQAWLVIPNSTATIRLNSTSDWALLPQPLMTGIKYELHAMSFGANPLAVDFTTDLPGMVDNGSAHYDFYFNDQSTGPTLSVETGSVSALPDWNPQTGEAFAGYIEVKKAA